MSSWPGIMMVGIAEVVDGGETKDQSTQRNLRTVREAKKTMRRAQPLGGGCGRLRGTILLLCTLYNLAQDPTSDGRDGAGAAGKEELSVVVMNDHASALGAWLTALRPHRDPPAAVVHIDRHSDLAAPRHCAFPHVQRWESCVDRAGFQLAAAWLGVVDRIWWLRPGRDFETTDSLWTLAIASPLGRGWPVVRARAPPDRKFIRALWPGATRRSQARARESDFRMCTACGK